MWISEAVAVTTAEHAMATQELLDEDARLAARDGRPDAPLLVVRLDEVDVGYYLVPWRTTEGIGLIVRVDAATGQLLGFQEFGAPLPPGLLRAEQAIEAFRAAFPATDVGEPRAVWFPCRESTTPFRPFFELTYQRSKAYVDMDGSLHLTLTPLGLGGS